MRREQEEEIATKDLLEQQSVFRYKDRAELEISYRPRRLEISPLQIQST